MNDPILQNLEPLGSNYAEFRRQFDLLINNLKTCISDPSTPEAESKTGISKSWAYQAIQDANFIEAQQLDPSIRSISLRTTTDDLIDSGDKDDPKTLAMIEEARKFVDPEELDSVVEAQDDLRKGTKENDYYVEWRFTADDKYELGAFIQKVEDGLRALDRTKSSIEFTGIRDIFPSEPEEPIQGGSSYGSLVIRYGVEDLSMYTE